MINKLNRITKSFILNEGVAPTFQSWIQALSDNLKSLNPRTVSDGRRVELMKHQLNELRKVTRRMHENINLLEDQIKLLQEEQK